MDRQKLKKLTLNKQTLRQLDAAQQEGIVGGFVGAVAGPFKSLFHRSRCTRTRTNCCLCCCGDGGAGDAL